MCIRDSGTGMYECMLTAKEQGKIAHIGVTAHKLQVAFECVESGLYETLQYPLKMCIRDRCWPTRTTPGARSASTR